MATPGRSRFSWVLLVVAVAALAVGAAASILVNAASTPSSSSGPAQLIFLPPWLLTLASFGILAFVGVSFIFMRLQGGSSSGQSQFAVRVLMAVLLATVFLLAVHALGLGTAPPPGQNSTSQNQTGSTPPATTGNHTFTGSGGIVVWPGYPAWLPFVILAGVVLLVVVVGAPELRRYLDERRTSSRTAVSGAEVAGVRTALAQAATDLQHGADPRSVILELYAALLTRLQPIVVGLDASTPEEIRAVHLERFGVRPGPARTLTRLFEEARYSVHPMGEEASRAAQDAVRAVLDDLDRKDAPA